MPLPTYSDVSALATPGEYTVPQEWVDYNGHMNIAHYFDIASRAGGTVIEAVGVDSAYMADRNLGVFTVEQHQKYVSEMRLGTRLTVRPRLIGVGGKALHIASYVLDEDKERLSMIYEVVLLHIDFSTRRAAPFPDDVRGRADTMLAAHSQLGWDPALSGSMAVR